MTKTIHFSTRIEHISIGTTYNTFTKPCSFNRSATDAKTRSKPLTVRKILHIIIIYVRNINY